MKQDSDAILITQIRSCAMGLPPAAVETANELHKFAEEIEMPATREEALRRFNEYAWHWKGLRDSIVPGVLQKDWVKQVIILSKYARAAVKSREPAPWWGKWFK